MIVLSLPESLLPFPISIYVDPYFTYKTPPLLSLPRWLKDWLEAYRLGNLPITPFARNKFINLTRRQHNFLCLERATIADRQGANEDQKFVAKPTQLNMNLFLANGIMPSIYPILEHLRTNPHLTHFTKQVLLRLTEIPQGSTLSYRQVAEAVGSPRAERAVGSICAKNPYPLFVPCHRVTHTRDPLSKRGRYLFGAKVKYKLLEHEKRLKIAYDTIREK
jgi:O-6-methylguanine DNA methyltransferase